MLEPMPPEGTLLVVAFPRSVDFCPNASDLQDSLRECPKLLVRTKLIVLNSNASALNVRIAAGPLAGQTGWTSQFGLLAELPSGGHLPLEFAPSDESAVAPGSAPALREQRP